MHISFVFALPGGAACSSGSAAQGRVVGKALTLFVLLHFLSCHPYLENVLPGIFYSSC